MVSAERITPRRKRRKPHWRELATDHEASAASAGLEYVYDSSPGISRRRLGKGFVYVDAKGRRLRDAETLRRIRALAIPPAWTEVWICPTPHGHLQASGRDARRRKQYRYHPSWHEVRDGTKFERMLAFGKVLPRIRARVEKDLALPGLPRDKVLATVVSLLERTLIRVGNEEYARTNESYGLTTFRDEHVQVAGQRVRFRFRGKSGKEHVLELQDARLARIVGRCQSIPGQELFQYVDEDGERQSVGSADVNAYLREVSGEELTAKDFRTWAGTVLASHLLRALPPCERRADAKKNVMSAVKAVAERLGNTPAVCRRSYIHPAVLDDYLVRVAAASGPVPAAARALADELGRDEAELLRMLEKLAAPSADAVVVSTS